MSVISKFTRCVCSCDIAWAEKSVVNQYFRIYSKHNQQYVQHQVLAVFERTVQQKWLMVYQADLTNNLQEEFCSNFY